MNTDPHFALVDQYFDGLIVKEKGASLTEAVETDYDALAYFCEAADMDACLQKLLAPAGRLAGAAVRMSDAWRAFELLPVHIVARKAGRLAVARSALRTAHSGWLAPPVLLGPLALLAAPTARAASRRRPRPAPR